MSEANETVVDFSSADQSTNDIDMGDVVETRAEGISEIYYDDKGGYWQEVKPDIWYKRTERQLQRYLKGKKVAPKAKDGKPRSEMEALLDRVEIENRVFYAGPLAGYSAGIYKFQGEPALVTRSPDLVQEKLPPESELKKNPSCPGFPLIGGILERMYNCSEEGIEQLPYLYGWWSHTLRCLYHSHPDSGLMLAIAGGRNSGKSLTAEIMRWTMGERVAKPYEYMIGRDSFNEEMQEAVLLLVDDEMGKSSPEDRKALKAWIKRTVANNEHRIRGLQKAAISLKLLWRPVFLLNEEPDNLTVLPNIDEDIEDKIMLLRAYRHEMPMPTLFPEEKEAFRKALRDELPYFVHYLLNYRPPDDILGGRYFVQPYKHPLIAESLYELSWEAVIWTMIQKVIFGSGRSHGASKVRDSKGEVVNSAWPPGFWFGTAAELSELFQRDEEFLPKNLKKSIPTSAHMGANLTKLADRYGKKRIFSGRCKKGVRSTLYVIMDEGQYDGHFTDGAESWLGVSIKSQLSGYKKLKRFSDR